MDRSRFLLTSLAGALATCIGLVAAEVHRQVLRRPPTRAATGELI
jgi:hypothetical protein